MKNENPFISLFVFSIWGFLMPIEIEDKNHFKKIIQTYRIVVVEFGSVLDENCKELRNTLLKDFEPKIENIKGTEIVHVDKDNNPEILKYFKIVQIPTVLIFHKGQIVFFSEQGENGTINKTDRFIGYNPDLPGYLFRIIEYLYKIDQNP